MALLGKIRNQFGWLMIVLVVLGLGGFLVMDFMGPGRGGNSGGAGSPVGKINGKKISLQAMEEATAENKSTVSEESRAAAWEQLVINALVDEQVEALGISVSQAEMGELFVGRNMSYTLMRRFGDPQTGQVDRNAIRAKLAALDNPDEMSKMSPDQQKQTIEFWDNIKKTVYRERLTGKYTTLLRQAVYTPSWMAGADYNQQNQTFDLSFVVIPFTAIGNDKVSVTDEELTTYIKENSGKFEREANASIEFAIFNILPSAADTTLLTTKANSIFAEINSSTTTANDSALFTREDGKMPYIYMSKDDMDEAADLKDSIFAAGKGKTFGPYIHNNSYKIVKVMDSKELADSVRYRRIFYPVSNQDQAAAQAAYKLMDSLKAVILENKVPFDTLVRQYSSDMASKAVGGDMGYIGRDQPEGGIGIDEYLLFEAKKDSVYILNAPEGGLQIVQVTGYKLNGKTGLRLGVLEMPIIPSKQTIDSVSAIAYNFLSKNRTLEALRTAAKEAGVPVGTANGLEVHGFNIPALGKNSTSAEIIKWANKEAKPSEVAKMAYAIDDEQFSYTRQFVVPVLVSKAPKGLATIADPLVKGEVERAVLAKKKAAVVKAAIAGLSSLDAIAAQYSSKVEMASAISYSTPFVAGNNEPKVAAVADILAVGAISAPISGREAIYVITVTAKQPAPAMPNAQIAGSQISQRASQAILSLVIDAFKKNAKIEDNRDAVYN